MNENWLLKLGLSLIWLTSGCYGEDRIADNLRMVWNDEFSGNSLDGSKWATPPAWFRQGGCYWSNDNHKMTGDGKVKLSVTESNDGTVYCGALRTHNKFDKKYGYFETRCTVPQIHGGWAAFWMMPYGNHPGNAGNDGTELDIFESINGWRGQINHALHWDGYGAAHQHVSEKMNRPDLYDGQYHVFGLMWTPEEYIFYIDNEETWRTSVAGVSDVNQYLKLTMEVSGQNWAGNWNDQLIKPIDWFVDYVRVYDYEPIIGGDVNLEFIALTNGQTFDVGDKVQMHIGVMGTSSQIDKIKFYSKKGNEPYVLRRTSDITSEVTYWYNWFPDQPGTYKLRARGTKDGVGVTNVITNVVVNGNTFLRPSQAPTPTPDPFSMEFVSLSSGNNYKVDDVIDMSVELSGDISDADEIQYLTKKDDGEFVVQKTQSLTGSVSYEYNWIPTEPGSYALRITATKSGGYVTHVVVGDVTVERTPTESPTHLPTKAPTSASPLTLEYRVLQSGSTYQIGEEVKMHVTLSGNYALADKLKFIVQKIGESGSVTDAIVISNKNVKADKTIYYKKWNPSEAGYYRLKVSAYMSGSLVEAVKAMVTIV
jgi:beta-glucanase (GH16 family)